MRLVDCRDDTDRRGDARPGIDDIEFEQMLISRYAMARRGGVGSRLDRSAYLLLSRLRDGGALTIAELSDSLFLDASTLQRQTAAAMRDGLIERIADPAGGVARKFVATSRGRDLHDEVRARNLESLGEILQDWTDEEIASYAALHRRFNEAVERRRGRAWDR